MICAALHDVGVQPVAPQIEEAVLEPDLLRILLVAEHRHRQFVGGAQHLDLVDVDLDRAGRQFGVLGAGRAAAHLAVDPHHPFGAQLLDLLERRAVRVGHHLAQAVMVAQVDEQHAAVIAHAMHPAGQPNVLADVAVAERAAGVGAVTMHVGGPSKTPATARARNRRTTARRPAPCQGCGRQAGLIVVNVLEHQHAAELALVVAGKAAGRRE